MRTPRLHELPPADALWLEIDLARQSLTVWQGRDALQRHAISSGAAGNGQHTGSGQTPLGWHYVRAAIGGGEPPGTVFRGRRSTGEVYGPALAAPTHSATGSSRASSGCAGWSGVSIAGVPSIPSAAIFTCTARLPRSRWANPPRTVAYGYATRCCSACSSGPCRVPRCGCMTDRQRLLSGPSLV